jgi:hypothetical protein
VAFFLQRPTQLVVFEQRTQQQPRVRGAFPQQVEDRIHPSIQPITGRATRRERARNAPLDLTEDPLYDGGVELGFAAEMMKESRFSQRNRLGNLAQADAGEAAPREQRFCGVENLFPRGDFGCEGRHEPTDRSVDRLPINRSAVKRYFAIS